MQVHVYMYTGQSVLAWASLYSIQAPRSTVATPPNDCRSHPLRMRINAFSGVEHVRIIEVPDKLGLDNRDSTVPCLAP